MTIKDLREFLDTLPEEFDNFALVNGEFGTFEPEGEEEEEEMYYRLDKPIQSVYVDEDSNEICFLHQTQGDVDELMGVDED